MNAPTAGERFGIKGRRTIRKAVCCPVGCEIPLFLVLTVTVMATNLLLALLIAAGLAVVAAVPGLRTAFTTYLTNNLTMLAAIMQEARGNKQLVWTKIEETRVSTETRTSDLRKKLDILRDGMIIRLRTPF